MGVSEAKPMDAMGSAKGYLNREVPGLVCAFFAVMMFLALISHSAFDPSLSSFSTTEVREPVSNFIGLAGAFLTAIMVDLLGLASFWTVLVFSLLSWRFFRGRPFQYPRLVVVGLILLLFSLAALFSMLFPRLESFWQQTPGGGLLGHVLAQNLIRYLNPVGAGLLVGALTILAVILATGFSLIRGAILFIDWLHTIQGRVAETRTKRREQQERSRRLQEALEKRKQKAPPKVRDKAPPPEPKPKQESFEFPSTDGEYTLPSLSLLDEAQKSVGGMSKDSLMANARMVEKKLNDFNVEGEVVEVSTGPVITMYEYQPAPGVKISKVAGLADDLAMNMRADAIRVIAPLPGKAAIGIEIPNPKREFVNIKEVVESPEFDDSKSMLTLVLGVDTMGHPVTADLAKMPHLLIAGATGSGKSVGLNAIIMSILFKAAPDEVRFLMIDPKRIELTLYKDLPHLIYPVVSDAQDANLALKWAVAEMEFRYKMLAELGVRNIAAFNRKLKKEGPFYHKAQPADPEQEEEEGPGKVIEPIPYLVLIIDELADLMMVSPKEVEASITRLAQMARAAGIHLILATQRPSVDVLTGVIKANLPTRISFQVSSKIDSRTILDTVGSEKLLGMGDMLYLPPGTSKVQRIHGAYVSETEIQRVTDFIRAQRPPDYLEELAVEGSDNGGGESDDEYDEKYDEAVELVTKAGKASISLIQRHLRIGYNRAARIIEVMEREGVIGPADGARPRQVLVREL